jgi:hypothetical protein
MSKTTKLALAAAIPMLLLAGCSDFLKGPGLNTNPNKPTSATNDQLWVGVEVAVMAQWENYPLMLFQTWAQQIAGINRQWQTYATYSSGIDENAADGAWNQTYGPGGLRDLKQIQASLTDLGAIHWRGETEVLEALYMGTAADIWGSIPYSDAMNGSTPPTFDTQAAVYTQVLAKLDAAITDLASTDTKLPLTDFFYNNNAALWTRAAHTLKARFLMHTAATSATTYNNATLASVITEAGLGIQKGGDLVAVHTGTPGEQNLFYSFQFSRAGDVGSAAPHIKRIQCAEPVNDLATFTGNLPTGCINQVADAFLLPKYYTPNRYGNYYGSTAGLPGDAPAGKAADSVAFFEVTNDPKVAWPIVSNAENQMLLAEAQYRSVSAATGLATLNAFRVANGSAAITPAPAGVFILEDILREKFIRNFFNMEVWNDYNRTCYPNTPQPQTIPDSTISYVPGRLPVGYTEQATNPNVPAQPSGNPMNANNFKHATALDGAVCHGQIHM